MKKTIAAILALTVCMSYPFVAFAEQTTTEEKLLISEKPTEIKLSLEEAIKLAVTNSPRIEAGDAAITSAELSLESANDTQKDIKKVKKYLTVSVSDGLDVAYLKHGYYPLAAQVGLDLAMLEKEQITSQIAYNVTSKYYNVKLVEELVKIGEAGVEIAKDNLAVVKTSFELGYVSQLEVTNAENSVTSAEFSLEGYKRNYEIAVESLKIDLGIDNTDYTLVLTDETYMPELPEETDALIDKAMDTRYDITALKKSSELQSRYFEITNMYVGEGTALYHSAYSDYLSAKYTYENTQKLIKLSLKNDYMTILTAKDNVTVAKNNLAVKEIEYNSAKIKYEMGVITNLELTAVMTELDSCRVQYENARTTYLLEVLRFGYNTTIGI